jgi:flagellin
MRINHNIQALNAYRNLSQTMSSTSKSLEKLSSGLRINKASDDAAGLAISEKMRSQIRGLNMAERNTLDAVSLIQTGEGALNEVHSILQRMRELSVQSANGTLEDQDREAIQDEINQLTKEIDRIADTTQFNQKKLFSGSPEGRAFAEAGSSQVRYAGIGIWEGPVSAAPTEPASVELVFDEAVADITEADIDGKTFVIGGKTYEIDITGNGALVGIDPNNIAVNLTAWPPPADNDARAAKINSLITSLKEAIETNDSGSNTALDNPTFQRAAQTDADALNISGKLQLTTINNMSPLDASGIGVSTDLDGVRAVDPADSSTPADTLVAKKDALNSTSVPITFSEAPKAGDALGIDNLVIEFVAGGAASYTSGTSAQVDVSGKDTFTILNEVKEILIAAQLDTVNNPVKNLANNFDVVGSTLIVGTTKTKDVSFDGMWVEIQDGDFEANQGKELSLKFQIGANSSETLDISIGVMDAGSLGIGLNGDNSPTVAGINAVKGLDVMTPEGASAAIKAYDEAIKRVSAERSKLGSIQNRLEYTTNNLQMANENLTSAESRIRDLDMAEEMTNFTRNNILNQAGQAMLAQANQLPQGILQLLK